MSQINVPVPKLSIQNQIVDQIKNELTVVENNKKLIQLMENKISNKIIDTLELARSKFPGSSSSLDALCKRYRIDNSRRVQHTALIDCDLLAKVYINLIDQKEPTLNFKNEQSSEIEK